MNTNVTTNGERLANNTLTPEHEKRLAIAACDFFTCQERNNDWLDFLFELQCEAMKGDMLEDANEDYRMDVTIKFRLLRNFLQEVEVIDRILNP